MSPKTEKTQAICALVGDALIDRADLAEVIGMTPGAISVALHRGCFPLQPIRIGRRLRWRLSDVRTYLTQAGEAAR